MSARWPWWAAPAAVVLALALTLLGAPFILAAGDDDSGTVQVALTVLQDLAFIAAPLVLAGLLAQRARPDLRPFGLVRVPLGRSLKWMGIALASYAAVAVLFAQIAGGKEQKDLFEMLHVDPDSAGVYVVAFVVCVLAPLAEEFLFRGFCYSALRSALTPAGAVVAVGAVFGLVHFGSTPAVLLLQLAVLGALLCVVREATGSLLPCIALHATNNAISFGALVHWGAGTLVLLVASLAACAAVLAPLSLRSADR